MSQQRKGSLREVPPTKVCERGEHSTRLVTTAPRERGKIILVEVAPPANLDGGVERINQSINPMLHLGEKFSTIRIQ